MKFPVGSTIKVVGRAAYKYTVLEISNNIYKCNRVNLMTGQVEVKEFTQRQMITLKTNEIKE